MRAGDVQDLFSVEDKVAVITGASKGIGKDIAQFMGQAGANVVLVARNKQALEDVANEIRKEGQKVLSIPADLTNVKEIPLLVNRIRDEFGTIDILINNAGKNITKPALEVTEDDWDQVLDINLKSVFFLSQAIGKVMIENKSRKIVNMSSQMAHVGYYKRSAYSSSKGGLMQLTKALAIEWAQYQINVNCIAPTFIETPMTQPMFEDQEFFNDVINRIPMGRLGKTEDLFGALLYLSSGASDLVTGQSMIVDGGWTVW